ncbi:hypothetical protein G4F55_001820 [Campylobacter jejuni]|nr:hypothetical protein [Campylobacter jejuni]
MNCFKKLKEKIILIKIEKEKASEEKFLKECEILKSEAMFIIFLILFSSLIAPVAIYEMFREKEEVEG